MFRNPINAFPYANAVDLTDNGDKLPISFTFQGDILRQWCVEIRDNTSDTIYYTSAVQNNINNPKYNGDICTLTLTVGSGGITATTITDLSWSVYMNDSTTLMTATDLKVNSGTYQSNDFYFINSDTPFLTEETINGVAPQQTINTVNSYQLIYNATYGNNDTNTPLKYYKVTLTDSHGDIVVETNNRYTAKINFQYDGLANGETYLLSIELVTQVDLSKVYNYNIACSIEGSEEYSTLIRSIETDNINCCNVLQWYYAMGSNGTYTGTGSPTFNNSRVTLESGTLVYDEINGEPIILSGEGFGYSVKLDIPLSIVWDDQTHNLITCDVQNQIYRITVGNGYLNFLNKSITSPFFSNMGIICPLFTQDKFAIQNTNVINPTARYLWYNDTTNIWRNNNSYYWLTGLGAGYISVVISVFYRDSNKTFYYYVNGIQKTTSYDSRYSPNVGDNVSFTLYAPNVFDNFIVNNVPFTNDEINTLNTKDIGHDYTTLNWDNFPNAFIICNYVSDVNSSSVGLGSIQGYLIQRQKMGETTWTTVYNGEVNQFLQDDTYTLMDYNISNNTNYLYRFIPLISGDITPQVVVYEQSATNPYLLTDWEVFTLTPLEITLDQYNSEYKNATPVTINGKPLVWSFISNCEESALTKTQDKTYFDTFVQYPRVSVGKAGYFNLTFSALLGTIDENCNYYEPSYLIDQWNEFINSNYICLYKNLKGDCRIVSINSDGTNTYANLYANKYADDYYYTGNTADENIGFITNKPTTISVNLTEVDDAKNYRIVSG